MLALESTVVYLLLSKYDNQQVDMLHRLKLLKDMELIPQYLNLINLFIKKEIIGTPFIGQSLFEQHVSLTGTTATTTTTAGGGDVTGKTNLPLAYL